MIRKLTPKTAQGRGGLYLTLSAIFFLIMSVFVKSLKHFPVEELVVFRSIVSAVICLFFIRKEKLPIWGNRKKILILRGVLGAGAMFLMFTSLHLIPLASTTVLIQTAPIFTLLLGIPLLGEKPGGIQWIFFIGAIVGVSIVKGFDSSAPWTHYLPAFGSAMIAGLAHNLVRMLRKTDHPQIIIFYLAWVSFVISLPLSIGTWVWPNAREYILVLSLGIFMQLGQFYMTKAYATAPMASILHFNYVSTVLATIVGYFFFNEILPLPVLGGIALIIVSVYCANRFAKLMIVRP